MPKYLIFDFKCPKCGIIFEDTVNEHVNTVKCVNCGHSDAEKQISASHIWWRRMGVSTDFPTSASKWTKMQWEKNRRDKGGRADGQPNLKEY